MNGEQAEAGAIHCFADEAALQAYLAGPIVAGLVSHPRLRQVSLKQFAVLENVSAVTQAPIDSRLSSA